MNEPSTRHHPCATALSLALTLITCASAAGAADADAAGHEPRPLSQAAEEALKVLEGATVFRDAAVGYAGRTPEEVKAFGRLLRLPRGEAAAAFKRLLRRGKTAGRLYALSGLYFTDPKALAAALPRLQRSEGKVRVQRGCITRLARVAELVRKPGAVRLARGQSLEDWTTKNDARARKGFRIDIAGGGYPWSFKAATVARR